jgi:transcriptional regulator with XRE-family HTH domain
MTIEHTGSADYWPSLVQQIRRLNRWSQEHFAEEIGSNQETVSRWERGLVIPSLNKQVLIEKIAEELHLSSLGGVASIVRLSPFPMLLCDRKDMVIAASPASGFREGETVLSQTPPLQHAYYKDFIHGCEEDGFWSESGQTRRYDFDLSSGHRLSAVLVSINVRGEMYCVVQAIPHALAELDAGQGGARS